MKHILNLILFSLFLSLAAEAQQISPQTINAAGNTRIAGSVMLEDAIGGLLVSHFSTVTFLYTQDFLQPDVGTTDGPIYINDVVLDGKDGFDNAGTTFVVGNTMIEFTLGEFACTSLIGSQNMLTQGILQPYRIHVWTGLVNTDWPNIGNWEGGYVPSKSDEALIPPACPNYPYISNGVLAKCRLLTVNPAASVIVGSGGNLSIYNIF